jgi:hypothetical protein
MYRDDEGIPKDPAKFVSYMKQAAELRYGPAMYEYGYLLMTGLPPFVPQNIPQGVAMTRDAAIAGNLDAMLSLAKCYAHGMCVAKSFDEAKNLCTQVMTNTPASSAKREVINECIRIIEVYPFLAAICQNDLTTAAIISPHNYGILQEVFETVQRGKPFVKKMAVSLELIFEEIDAAYGRAFLDGVGAGCNAVEHRNLDVVEKVRNVIDAGLGAVWDLLSARISGAQDGG